ncbi:MULTISPECIES: DUF488 family protein [Asticcacaulis]|uniref:DUF488 domain-containing protein n=1 Tax=Asticcacaulis TaxID=76890 RepID=UPI001AE28396|nr:MULTISPECIES: DUF488 domain-containing protein [Asticcacaulis]MBP2160281.1 uncharacterized protein (DUF488 family) [Asticcacaulis solisilvae]MDR6801416.1 uncharacterized protein (DUF488 family) [Asticcacaulis sp. BE141]
MSGADAEILTIGHSTLSYEHFLELLRKAAVNAIADVRSSPFSKHFPHFNRHSLRTELRRDNIAYVFLGDELGGRPKDNRFFCEGVADYEKMAKTEEFAWGLDRVIEGAKKYRIAMMCSEHNPLDCHRCLLVGRALHERKVSVRHILGNGRTVDQSEIEARLMEISGKSHQDFFEPAEKRLSAAYRDRAMKVAFSMKKDQTQNSDRTE